MRIALATCSTLPAWERDDLPLYRAFAARGVEAVEAIWDDASINWRTFDACVIRTTWDYTARRDAFVKWALHVESVTTLLNPAAIVQWNTDKQYLRDLEPRGVRIVPTIWLERGGHVKIADVMNQHGWRAGFIKPVVGSTARETLRFECDAGGLARAHAHIERLLQNEALMLQPYLRSVETRGEWSAIFIDNCFSHAVQKIPVAGDYRVQDDFGAHDRPLQLDSKQMMAAERAIAAVGTRLLYARADFLIDDEGHDCLTELELVEPSLFFRHAPEAADRFAQAVIERCTNPTHEGAAKKADGAAQAI